MPDSEEKGYIEIRFQGTANTGDRATHVTIPFTASDIQYRSRFEAKFLSELVDHLASYVMQECRSSLKWELKAELKD